MQKILIYFLTLIIPLSAFGQYQNLFEQPVQNNHVLSPRVLDFLFNNYKLKHERDKYEKVLSVSETVSLFIHFSENKVKSAKVQYLSKGPLESSCQIFMLGLSARLNLCANKIWKQTDCLGYKWPREIQVFQEDSCFINGKLLLFLFKRRQPNYLDKYWGEISTIMGKEFSLQPSGILKYDKNIGLVYL